MFIRRGDPAACLLRVAGQRKGHPGLSTPAVGSRVPGQDRRAASRERGWRDSSKSGNTYEVFTFLRGGGRGVAHVK